MAKLNTLGDHDFAEVVGERSGIVAVDFSAAWCPPCRILKPLLESTAEEFEGRIEVRTFDTDLNPRTASRLGIRGLPTVVFFRDGREIDRLVGAVGAGELRGRFERAIASA